MEIKGQPMVFPHSELVALMLKEKGIHEGHWVITAVLGFAPMNIGQTPGGEDSCPAGAVIVQNLGIQEVAGPLPNSVDAAIANPLAKKVTSRAKATAKK